LEFARKITTCLFENQKESQKKMIIVYLKGGLGNQIFQYAAGRSLAIKRGVALKLDTSFLHLEATDYTKREFELDKFNIEVEFASKKEIKAIKRLRWRNFFLPTWILEAKQDDCYSLLRKTGKNCYLDGYFQSEKYFLDCSEQIRQELTFKKSLISEGWTEIKQQLANSNSVSLHFRRGDYVSNLDANKFHGVCSMDYYQKAIGTIAEKVENPHFFVFSDDIQWVIENFKIDFPTVFVEKKDENLHSDFQLMSLCKHNIIANSSYSWWAAWLNNHINKIVIAPEKWYANEDKQKNFNELIPSRWITI
jgi:hypothetical protein